MKLHTMSLTPDEKEIVGAALRSYQWAMRERANFGRGVTAMVLADQLEAPDHDRHMMAELDPERVARAERMFAPVEG